METLIFEGYGDGHGDGDGNGNGHGYGNGHGHGYGDGYGDGHGDGHGDGNGDGYGHGYGNPCPSWLLITGLVDDGLIVAVMNKKNVIVTARSAWHLRVPP